MPITFFDMDYTLLRKSSSTLYVKYLARRRMISLREMIGVSIVTLRYTLNILDFPKATAQLSKYVRGGNALETQQLCESWVQEDVLRFIAPKAIARLREHQQQGHTVVLLSASTQFVVLPVAKHLGIIPRYTELEVGSNGQFTGNLVGEACYGEGKRIWGERIAQQYQTALSDCWFYTDSYSDRPLMDVVGHPTAVNPDHKLRSYAQEHNWPIEMFY